MRLLVNSAMAMLVVLALTMTGCGQPQDHSDEWLPPAGPGESGSSYFDTRDPAQLQQWASHVVVATVTDRRAEEQVITAAPGGPESPVEGPVLYSYRFAVEEVLWSHDHAVSSLGADAEFVALGSGDGSLRSGDEYVVSVVDDFQDEQQVIGYLDAQKANQVDIEELTAALTTPSPSVDPANRPAPTMPFGDRIHRYVTGTN